MKFIEYVNTLLKQKVSNNKKLVLYGQNVTAGSCLSGLTKGLNACNTGAILNTPNAENTMCGIGFGMMLNGISSIFFMKQQDFLLLGMDHLVNTYNILKMKDLSTSFTIFTIIVDTGYEGPQSRLNNFTDYCSIAGVPGYIITNPIDAKYVLDKHLIAPGFRIIGISQRMFKNNVKIDKISLPIKDNFIQYTQGNDVTIVCFNLAFSYGKELETILKENGLLSSLFTVNSILPNDWSELIANLNTTKRLVIIDDSKSVNLPYQSFLNEVQKEVKDLSKLIVVSRSKKDKLLQPNHDRLIINYNKITGKLLNEV